MVSLPLYSAPHSSLRWFKSIKGILTDRARPEYRHWLSPGQFWGFYRYPTRPRFGKIARILPGICCILNCSWKHEFFPSTALYFFVYTTCPDMWQLLYPVLQRIKLKPLLTCFSPELNLKIYPEVGTVWASSRIFFIKIKNNKLHPHNSHEGTRL